MIVSHCLSRHEKSVPIPGVIKHQSRIHPGQVPTHLKAYTHLFTHAITYHRQNANDTQLIFFFPSYDTTASARISANLADILSYIAAYQLKLNRSKTELLFHQGDPNPGQGLAISLNNSLISPRATAHNLGVIMNK